MSQSAVNRAAVLRVFEEVFNQGRVDLVDELFRPDVVFYSTAHPDGVVHGRAEYKEFVLGLLTGFPDLRFDVKETLAEGDLVAVRALGYGTHTGEYQGIPPTGRRIELKEMLIVRGVDGQCAVAWSMPDVLGVMRQLGLAPSGNPPRVVLRMLVGVQRLGARLRGRRADREDVAA